MKVLALTKDGKMTWCTASEKNIGKGRCNHIAHQKNNESVEDFCKRVKDININYDNNDNIIDKIKDLKANDKIKLIESEDVSDEILDILVNDKNCFVREAVAKHGRNKDLDILVNDEYSVIREVIAEYGRDKDLDILVNDEDIDVRREVAEYGRGKDLDILVNDEDSNVRYEVAMHGRDKDLDILIHDKDSYIRAEVARRGREKDLNSLINDEDNYVRDTVVKNENFKYDKRLATNDGRLEMIKEGCSGKEMDFIRKDPNKNEKIKLALIKKGIDVEKFLTDENKNIQKAAFEKIVK